MIIVQPLYAILRHSCEYVPRCLPYLRPTCHFDEPFIMHLSVFKMQSSLTFFISSSFLAQLVIPAYGATSANDLLRSCVKSDDWITPPWPVNIMDYCQGVLNELEITEREVHQISGPLHEFLPVGMAQKPYGGQILEPVRTPWKLVNGALPSQPHTIPYSDLILVGVLGPCTLTVTTLDRIDSDFLPDGIPAYPYPESGVLTWRGVFYSAVALGNLCVRRGRAAGVMWLDSSNDLPLYWNVSRH